MTATNLGLNGQPVKFLGAYVKNVSSSFGMSTNPSTVNVTLVEDSDNPFEFPDVGSYQTINVGPSWIFGGIITRYEIDVRNISGRSIRVTMADPREIMKNAPVILAPGSDSIVSHYNNTSCSLIDVWGAYNYGIINLSDWNQAGMAYGRIAGALKGGDIRFGESLIRVEQQFLHAYNEVYEFDFSDVTAVVDEDYRINTNLISLSNIIEDISKRHAFDWYVESEVKSNGTIRVYVRIIDRSTDNFELSLPDFLSAHEDKVITATSGVELRNDIACLALQGALVEQMTRVEILGLANEPLDLTHESGTNSYVMEEDEMRAVLAGKIAWEIWLGQQRDYIAVSSSSGTARESIGGFSRYGGSLKDDYVNELVALADLGRIAGANIPINSKRQQYLNVTERRELVGRVFSKLEDHAKATYGKRWVHDDVFGDIIQSCWTRDVVAVGDSENRDDPNEYFRQEDGRTRAYVEFSAESAGGAFSLGLSDLTNLFGDQNIFANVTRFGNTFSNRLSTADAILVLELSNSFAPANAAIDIPDTTNYVYKEADSPFANLKTSLYVAATVDKDGVISIPGGIFEAQPTRNEILVRAILNAQHGNPVTSPTNTVEELRKILKRLGKYYGNNMWQMHARAFQPKYAYIPTRSKYTRYGPVFSSELDGTPMGQLKIMQDDGFAPWEFGGISFMLAAMQLKVDNATSLQKEAFSANIQVEGYPLYTIGTAIDKNANITSMSMSFGDGGVKTSYQLQSFTRKFGEMSNQDWARLTLILNTLGASTPTQQLASYVTKYNVDVAKKYNSIFRNSLSNLNGGALDFG